MKKVRIIERKSPDGTISFIIQQKHFIFRWMWVDAWINSFSGACCVDSFDSLKEAKGNLCYFDGSKCSEKIVYRQSIN